MPEALPSSRTLRIFCSMEFCAFRALLSWNSKTDASVHPLRTTFSRARNMKTLAAIARPLGASFGSTKRRQLFRRLSRPTRRFLLCGVQQLSFLSHGTTKRSVSSLGFALPPRAKYSRLFRLSASSSSSILQPGESPLRFASSSSFSCRCSSVGAVAFANLCVCVLVHVLLYPVHTFWHCIIFCPPFPRRV